jgi:hypothetical protein
MQTEVRLDRSLGRRVIRHLAIVLAVWLCSVWLCGCLAVWLFGCLAVWLFGCLAVWLFFGAILVEKLSRLPLAIVPGEPFGKFSWTNSTDIATPSNDYDSGRSSGWRI